MPRLCLLSVALCLVAVELAAQQAAGPPFDATVTAPAYPASGARHPRVRIDEGHFNRWSTRIRIEGRSYAGFAELLRNDGYVVTPDTTRFTPEGLRPYDMLIVAGAGPVPDSTWNRTNWELESFTRDECRAVEEWVRGGGSLLLSVSHAPWGWLSRHLAARFGVDVVSSFTGDSVLSEYPDSTRGTPGAWLTYTRQNGMLVEHPIVNGRGPAERIGRVRGGGGSSIVGPTGSIGFLALRPTAFEQVFYLPPGAPDAVPVIRSAAGRAQGVAVRFGAGRVVVVSTSHLFFESYMARPGHDNRQLALNVMHWLSGLLDPPAPVR